MAANTENSLPLLPSRQETRRGVEFSYQNVQLLRNNFLGNGAYGIVCKAVVDGLMCAAKIMHQVFFQVSDSDPRMMRQFDQECDFLSGIRHPCIVQYLGKYHDPESRLPVLLMELMDESLTKFLDNSLKVDLLVPYHIQLNISHDIAMALAFLHSNGIIHRDLSSNNVLLLAGCRAKVADFGMSKLVEVNPRMTPLTQCPGTLVYMPPEALRFVPKYSKKLDVFATGVLIIQIITCLFPDPTAAKRSFQDERLGIMEVPIPEQERRQKDIELVKNDHPLLSIALECLCDKEQGRPTSLEICQRLAALKEGQDYIESVQEAKDLPLEVRRLRTELASTKQDCDDLREQMDTATARIVSLEKELQNVREEAWRLREECERRATEPLSVDLNRLTINPILKSMPNTTNAFEDQSISASREGDLSDIKRSTSLEAQLDLEAPDPSLWYHGPVSREQACHRLISVGKPGSYLIRKSDNLHVLSFLDREDRCHHFKIVERNGRFNIGGSVWFSSLTKLVGFHSKYSSVVEKHSERLDNPVPPPSPVHLPASV